MSEIGMVNSGNDSGLFDVEVGLMMSEALKEAGTVLVLQKGNKALVGGGKNVSQLKQRISGGVAEKRLKATICTTVSV